MKHPYSTLLSTLLPLIISCSRHELSKLKYEAPSREITLPSPMISESDDSSTSALSADNLYKFAPGINGDKNYQSYAKFTMTLSSSGTPTKLYIQNQRFSFHSDFIKTLPDFLGGRRTKLIK